MSEKQKKDNIKKTSHSSKKKGASLSKSKNIRSSFSINKKISKHQADGYKQVKKTHYFSKSSDTRIDITKWTMDAIALLIALACLLTLIYSVQSAKNDGVPTLYGTSYAVSSSNDSAVTSGKGVAFKYGAAVKIGDIVVYENDDEDLNFGILTTVSNGNYTLEIGTQTVDVPIKDIKGLVTSTDASPVLIAILYDPNLWVYFCIIPMFVLLFMGIICYFILYPKQISIPFFEEMFSSLSEDNNNKSVDNIPTINNASDIWKQFIQEDDTISPFISTDNTDGKITNYKVNNYYTSLKSKDGEVYCLVKKFYDNISSLQEFGASDMDIIRVNMAGNTELEKLLTSTKLEKSLDLKGIIEYTNSLPNIYCIKKRGTINWTFKYKQKTLLIIRENSGGFKVSIKVYPDAAEKINIIYKALEDSNFPSGPFWFMFNDLKNLSGSVVKWLINESYRISKLQQVRNDLVSDLKPLSGFKINILDIRNAIDAGENIIVYPKFAIIVNDYNSDTLLSNTMDSGIAGVDLDKYIKEILHISNVDNKSISLLLEKSASEELTTSLASEMNQFISIEKSVELETLAPIPTSIANAKKTGRR